MNQVTRVLSLNSDVGFIFADGSKRLLSLRKSAEFQAKVKESESLPIDFATPQRRLVYVANRFFN